MYTPQQLQQITFDKAVFGGYDMDSVDEVLEPLINDYETLYRENATLKSKMRVLVEKLEEYRKNEGSVKEALRSAQRTCDTMVREAEKKCLDMLHAAQTQTGAAAAAPAAAAPVAPTAPETPAPVQDDQRLRELKAATMERVALLEKQLKAMEEVIAQMKAQSGEAADAPVFEEPKEKEEEAVAREIAESLERIVGTTEDEAPVAPVSARTHSSTTSRFTNMDLQFGKNYDPTKRR